MVIYSIDQDTVEPVFYPVVPDAFMKRRAVASSRAVFGSGIEWTEAFDSILATPRDPWSF